jgi:hypothetical protein
MKRDNNTGRKLRLNKDTVRTLSETEIRQAAGGLISVSATDCSAGLNCSVLTVVYTQCFGPCYSFRCPTR